MRTLILFLCLPLFCLSQVGINTTTPEARLEIRSSNQATPSNIDGILIPKIDEYPAANPTAAQDGMLVYATGNGSVTKGFYYWNNTTTSWVSFTGATIERINDLVDGKSDNDGTNDGSSIFLGTDAGVNDDGSDNRNVGIGYETLSSNTWGYRNIAFGYQVLANNTTGYRNTGIGYGSLNTNTFGFDNSVLGYLALGNNTTGFFNSAFGSSSLSSNTTGYRNSAFGVSALESNLSGAYNAAFGDSALYSNTTGNRNSAFGEDALYSNTTGNGNTVIGAQAGYNNNGSRNVFIGYSAGFHETGSQRLYIDVIGNTNPLIYGEFDNDLVRTNGDLEVVKAANSTLKVKTNDGNSSSLSLLEGADYGFEFLYTGSDDKLNLWSRTFAGNEGQRMTWLKDGKVGMNDTSPDARLDIEAINQATPNNTDGILIPRIDAFPATNPGANQNGMLVFLTSDNSFYYWNNTTTSWQKISGVERIDDLVDGKSDNDGSNNGSSIFLGVNAGANDNSTDNRNVAIGYYAMNDNITGDNNSALGHLSLSSNTSGDYNVAIGNRSLRVSTVGNQNTAVGFEALEVNTGNYNTAVGYIALDSNTSGYGNTAIGNQAMSTTNTGDSNTSIGYRSMLDNTSGDDNVAVGYHALQNNTTANSNVAVGVGTLSNITTGYSNTAIGSGAGAAGATFYNTTALGSGAAPNSPNQVRLGNASVSVIGGYSNWSNFSDRRLKRNIQDNVVGLEFIKKLRPVSYNYDMEAIARFENTPDSLRFRDAEHLKAQEVQTGFIAQEVEAAANAVGFDFHGIVKPYDANGTYALRYAEFVVPLVKAMQEQQAIIEAQQEELIALRKEIEDIKALLKKE